MGPSSKQKHCLWPFSDYKSKSLLLINLYCNSPCPTASFHSTHKHQISIYPMESNTASHLATQRMASPSGFIHFSQSQGTSFPFLNLKIPLPWVCSKCNTEIHLHSNHVTAPGRWFAHQHWRTPIQSNGLPNLLQPFPTPRRIASATCWPLLINPLKSSS